MGHTPSTAGTFRKNSGKTPEALSERFLEFPSRVRLGSPKHYNSRDLEAPEHFQNCLPPSTAGDASFFRSGSGEGLSEPVMEIPAVLGVFLGGWGLFPPLKKFPCLEKTEENQNINEWKIRTPMRSRSAPYRVERPPSITCLLACWGAEKREISESAPRVLSRVLSEIGVLSRVLPRVLSRVLFLLFCAVRAPSRALSGALPRAPRFLRALSRALGELFRRFPLLGSLAGQQTRST